jgi:hypothetical protein
MEFLPLNGNNIFTADDYIFWSHENESDVDKVPTEWWCEKIPGGARTDLPENYFTHNGIEYGDLLFPASHISPGIYRLSCRIVHKSGLPDHNQQWFLTVPS